MTGLALDHGDWEESPVMPGGNDVSLVSLRVPNNKQY